MPMYGIICALTRSLARSALPAYGGMLRGIKDNNKWLQVLKHDWKHDTVIVVGSCIVRES